MKKIMVLAKINSCKKICSNTLFMYPGGIAESSANESFLNRFAIEVHLRTIPQPSQAYYDFVGWRDAGIYFSFLPYLRVAVRLFGTRTCGLFATLKPAA